ncbi:F-box only protein 34 [Osmerus mordax]|uniref:F-box only protein 34 n=1 Tax=Osmerus mordax TaxID=8014 RepID=UPI00350EF02A
MHLKPHPHLQKSELRLETCQDIQRTGLHHQGAMKTEWGLLPSCPRSGSTNPSLASGGRSPLTFISTNHNVSSNGGPASRLSSTWARRSKSSPSSTSSSQSPVTFTSSLLLLTSGLDHEASFSLYQAQYQTQDGEGEGPLDIWAVIKPGNTKEKIAIFASQLCGGRDSGGERDGSDGSGGEEEGGGSGGEGGEVAQEAPDCGLGPGGLAVRTVSIKVKGCWESECSVAKRRRRSTHHQVVLREGARLLVPHTQGSRESSPAREPLSQPPLLPERGVSVEEQDCRVKEGETEEESGKTLSVVEMVAFLEQRASDQLVDPKPVSLRSSTTITLSKVPPTSLASELLPRDNPDEEGESVRVSDMVAKLESECLKRKTTSGDVAGELSRSNSLRRSVGRVLLAGVDACSASTQPPTPPTQPQDHTAPSPPESPAGLTVKPSSWFEPQVSLVSALPSPSVDPACGASIQARKPEDPSLGSGGLEVLTEGGSDQSVLPQAQASTDPTRQREDEPLPGMLFFSKKPSAPSSYTHSTEPHTLTLPDTVTILKRATDPEHSETLTSAPASLPLPTPLSTFHQEEEGEGEGEGEEGSGEEEGSAGREAVPFPLRRMVSHEFLEVRFKIQLLLEPQQYLAFLPHHVLLKIFSLLPTQALAALKCSCHYFKFVIESYGVRPADSRWVCDPRYKDDPCKQCKRRYGRGDVSLCRWHHKPYCQAMPYGPGYWMCCHGSHKDTPGCNVGLHDNRWVPAFHSINMPIYKRVRDSEEEA